MTETEIELEVLVNIVKAWNNFVKLPNSPDDVTDFRRSIHECQRIIATRQMQRIDPKWRSVK